MVRCYTLIETKNEKDVLSILRENIENYSIEKAFLISRKNISCFALPLKELEMRVTDAMAVSFENYNVAVAYEGQRHGESKITEGLRREGLRIPEHITASLTMYVESGGFKREGFKKLKEKSLSLIRAQAGKEDKAIGYLEKIEAVTQAEKLSGIFNIITTNQGKNRADLRPVELGMTEIDGVISAQSMKILGGFAVKKKYSVS